MGHQTEACRPPASRLAGNGGALAQACCTGAAARAGGHYDAAHTMPDLTGES
jgi:hypothetical protein